MFSVSNAYIVSSISDELFENDLAYSKKLVFLSNPVLNPSSVLNNLSRNHLNIYPSLSATNQPKRCIPPPTHCIGSISKTDPTIIKAAPINSGAITSCLYHFSFITYQSTNFPLENWPLYFFPSGEMYSPFP